jgi:hypothetical protein
MINIFESDIDKGNENIKPFILRKLDDKYLKKFDDLEDNKNKINKKREIPFLLNTIMLVSFCYSIVFFLNVFRQIKNKSLKELFKDDPSTIIIGLVLVITSILIFAIKHYKKNNSKIKKELNDLNIKSVLLIKECNESLKIPSNSIKLDVFYSYYLIRNNIRKNALFSEYELHDFYFFIEKNNLCIADSSLVFSFSLNSIKKIKEINQKITFIRWNKKLDFNDETCEKYKIKTKANGIHTIESFYSIEMEINKEQYFFIIPPYEVNKFLELTGLSICEQ